MAPDRQGQFERERQQMVAQQLAARGIHAPAVLAAMGRVPRERFVPEDLQECAYHDTPLPIAEGQTISQPYIVAYMVEALALQGGERVLEIGAGSGYAAAILAAIAEKVYTIERHVPLARRAAQVLKALHCDNVVVLEGDGTQGWPQAAPYDAIIVAAGGPVVPDALKGQLAIGGRLVIPVGANRAEQRLVRVTRHGAEDYSEEPLARVRFVPLVGEQGWPDDRGT